MTAEAAGGSFAYLLMISLRFKTHLLGLIYYRITGSVFVMLFGSPRQRGRNNGVFRALGARRRRRCGYGVPSVREVCVGGRRGRGRGGEVIVEQKARKKVIVVCYCQ